MLRREVKNLLQRKILKKPSDVKKGEGAKEGEEGAESKESELKEVSIAKPSLYQDCFVYYGVPLVRLS